MGETVPETTRLGAIEGGGSWLRLAVGDGNGRILSRQRLPTGRPAQARAAIIDYFTTNRVSALGVGFFGPLDHSTGALATTPKPGWSGAPLAAPLREALGIPVAIETDVGAAALGEAWLGAGRGAEVLLYLTVGTGIGGGLLHQGRLVGGHRRPELGHLAVPRQPDDHDFQSVCPFHDDCLEGLASGPALKARWGRELQAGHAGWDLQARYLAAGLRAALAVGAPDRVVLGGGVGGNAALWPPLLGRLREALGGYWPDLVVEDWLVWPGLGGDSALVGALWLAQGL